MRLYVSKNTCMFFTLLMGAVLLLASCSGSGESSGNSSGIRLSALILPERVSVVDPNATASSKPRAFKPGSAKMLMSGMTFTGLPASSDYDNDKPTVYVNERSLEAFDTVNNILCTIRQSRYDLMINQGPYKAQIDVNLCSNSRSNASSAGQASTDQSSGSTMPQYETDIFDSSRATAQSPQIVQVWAHPQTKPGDQPQVIYGKAVITEGADTAPPYGIFTINFKALDPADLSTVLFKGFLDAVRDPVSGKVLLNFSIEDANSYVIQKATLDKTAGNGAGSVYTSTSYPNTVPETTRFNIAYNPTNFLRTDNIGTQICLDRQKYDESAWKYGLYTAQTPTGMRVNVNSGFPVYKNGDYGWIGYWGVWFPDGSTLTNGETVAKHDYTTNINTRYTVLKSGGKLTKHTLKTITLGDIINVPLIWWDATGTPYQVVWDGSVFNKVARQNTDYTWANCNISICNPANIALTALTAPALAFFSQSLSGIVLVNFPAPGSPASPVCTQNVSPAGTFNCAPPVASASTPVIFYSGNIVYPTEFSGPTALACFDNCPDAAALSTNTPYKAISDYQNTAPYLATHATYTFDPTTMQLFDGVTSLVTATTGTSFSGGVSSGPLFDPAILSGPTDTLLGCDWAPTSQTCGGKAWSILPYFYTWETGPNEWNKFTGLIDGSGNPVVFDPPLQVQYTHHESGSVYDNAMFFLQYNGFGDLQGIPGKCVDVDTGKDADCSTSATDPSIQWVPAFTIPDTQADGSLTEVLAGPTTYYVKALEEEQRMSSALVSVCTGSGLSTTAYTLPSMSSWIDPALGPEPLISAPPAVIGGVLQ